MKCVYVHSEYKHKRGMGCQYYLVNGLEEKYIVKGSVESKVEGGKFGEEEKLGCPKIEGKGLELKVCVQI